MDSDDDQITRKQTTKKTKGRKKSTTTPKTKATANKKTKSNNLKNKRIKGFLDSDSDDEQDVDSPTASANKKPKLDSESDSILNSSTQIKTNLVESDDRFKMDDSTIANLSATPSISTQIFTATARLNVPLHENKPLNWSHKVNLIGSKSLDQRVQLCDLCKEPILYFGRLIPCKHVFCFDCATDLKEKGNNCLRCNEKIMRIERNSLNTVYMCNFDKQCKRTYLSQRDLVAHIQHRHTKKDKSNSSSEKSLKTRTHTFTNINTSTNKDDFQSTSLNQKSNNGHHSFNYPSPSLHTLQYVKQVQASTANANNANFKFNNSTAPQSWPQSNQNRGYYFQ